MKQKVVFLIHTEYHLIESIGIFLNYFDSDDYCIHIIRISPHNSKRILHQEMYRLKEINYQEFFVDFKNNNGELTSAINSIVAVQPNLLFLFLEESFWNNYLMYKVRRNGCKIILAPDGIKPYNSIKKKISAYFEDYARHLKYKWIFSYYKPLPEPERCYASSRYIDEVWVERPELYDNFTHKKVVKFNLPTNKRYCDMLNIAFGCSEAFEVLKGKTIIYFDQDDNDEVSLKRNVDLLCRLGSKFPDRRIFIKLHPSSAEWYKDYYRSIQNVEFLDNKYPAEMYIANCSDSILLSLFSTAMMFYNVNCRYYWIHPLYSDIFKDIKLKTPRSFINVVNNIDEFDEIY